MFFSFRWTSMARFHKKILDIRKYYNKKQSEKSHNNSNSLSDNSTSMSDELTVDAFQKILRLNSNYQKRMTFNEIEFNKEIMEQIKCSRVYWKMEKHQNRLTTSNIVNIFIKVIQIRRNGKLEREQTEEYQTFLLKIKKYTPRLSPEEVIKMLHWIKKTKVEAGELKSLLDLIENLLAEYSNKLLFSEKPTTEKYLNYLVVNIQSNIKFLHSLFWIYEKTGTRLQGVLRPIIREILEYFQKHVLKGNSLADDMNRKVSYYLNWQFIKRFIVIGNVMKMPSSFFHEMFLYYFRFKEKKSLSDLIEIEIQLMKCQFAKKLILTQEIGKRLFININNHLKNDDNLLATQPFLILKHMGIILQLSKRDNDGWGMMNLVNEAMVRISDFNLRIFTHYITGSYPSRDLKQDIIYFITYKNKKYHKNYLFNILMIYHRMMSSSKISIPSYSMLITLCIQHFNNLDFSVQCGIIYICIQRKVSNLEAMLSMFFYDPVVKIKDSNSNQPKEDLKYKKLVSKFQKVEQIHAYARLLEYWEQIRGMVVIWRDEAKEKIFFRNYLAHIDFHPSIEEGAFLLSQYVGTNQKSLEIIFRYYTKISESMRSFTLDDYDLIEDNLQQLMAAVPQSIHKVILTRHEEKQDLSELFKIRRKIRTKIQKCLKLAKFMFLLLENLKNKIQPSKKINLIEGPLAREVVANLEIEIINLKYFSLLTKQNYMAFIEIAQYVEARLPDAREFYPHLFSIYDSKLCQEMKGVLRQNQSELMAKHQNELLLHLEAKNMISLKGEDERNLVIEKLQEVARLIHVNAILADDETKSAYVLFENNFQAEYQRFLSFMTIDIQFQHSYRVKFINLEDIQIIKSPEKKAFLIV